MHYAVMFVDEHDLPDDREWVIARQGDTTMLFVQRDKITERMLERAWCGANLLANKRLEREHGITSAL